MASFSLYSPLPSLRSSKLHFSSQPLILIRNTKRICFTNTSSSKTKLIASSSSPNDASGDTGTSNFCIIEGPETVQDFVQMQLQEIQDNIRSRRNKIFLLMEEHNLDEVEEAKGATTHQEHERRKSRRRKRDAGDPVIDSLSSSCDSEDIEAALFDELFVCIRDYSFRGLIAPILELKVGLGGTSYEDFINKMHLPMQLSQVDPIVASFSGGAVGVISALMLLEINNVKQQEKKRCKYCHGTGYLACARCSASGLCLSIEPIVTSATDGPLRAPSTKRCGNCSGAGKVMCPTCLCTGTMMASEHDRRIEPFD